jgi:hypothetical protein
MARAVVEEGNLKVRIAALRPNWRTVKPAVDISPRSPDEAAALSPRRAYGGADPPRTAARSWWACGAPGAGGKFSRLRPSTDEALSFPSVQMFVERAAVTGEGVLGDAGAPLAADIYRNKAFSVLRTVSRSVSPTR